MSWKSGLIVMTVMLCMAGPARAQATLSTTTEDGVTIYGAAYFADLDASAPLILAFHQGGANGRGEYGPLAPWLNELGFRVIAWDQRAGGEAFGQTNRTSAFLPPDTPNRFCDAAADLQAALDFVIERNLADRVVVWGSSYSGALVFRLAAENPETVRAVIAFSPAAGEPLADCRARDWIDQLEVPALAVRPASEMARDSSIEQRDIFWAAGVRIRVIENGVHGSSMLVDERTGADMSADRNGIAAWLRSVAGLAAPTASTSEPVLP